jgi:hypothetical protein
MQAPALRPLGVGEILDAGFKIYTRNAWQLMKIVAIVVIPIQLIAAVIFLSTLEDPDALTGDGSIEDGSETWGFIAGNFVGSFLGWVALTIATGAVVKAIADAYLARDPDWRESLRFAGSRWRALLWLAFITTFFTILAFLALIIPGIWLSIAWIVAVPALMIEDCRGLKALKRSFRLVRKRWWPTFAVIAIAYILAAIVQSMVGVLFGVAIVAGADDSLLLAVAVNTLLTAIAAVIATPFQAAVTTITYFDLRVRKEGFDLQLLADRIGGDVPEQAPYAAPTSYGQPQPYGQPPQPYGQPPQPQEWAPPLPERPADPGQG